MKLFKRASGGGAAHGAVKAVAEASGGGAATLVVIIAALIMLYILFLPPDVREDLLGDINSNGSSVSGPNSKADRILLSESPGRLSFLEEKEIDHALSEVRLFTATSGNVIHAHNSLSLKKSWFTEKKSTQSFTLKDMASYDNFLLSFTAPEHRGRLVITLNGKQLFANSLPGYNVQPIKVPSSFLVEGFNVLEFSMESSSLRFWTFDEIVLESIQLTGDFTDVSSREGFSTFRVGREEFENLDRSRLRFFVDCFEGDPGILTIKLNRHTVFSAVPECDASSAPLDVTNSLDSGENTIEYFLEKGSVSIFSPQIKTSLKEPVNPVYYFELTDEEFKDVQKTTVNLTFTSKFLNNREWKNAQLIVNGHSVSMTTKEDTFITTLDPFIFKGTNALEIIPEDTLDIITLELALAYP